MEQSQRPDIDSSAELENALMALTDLWKGSSDPERRRYDFDQLTQKVSKRSPLAAQALFWAFVAIRAHFEWLSVDRFLEALKITSRCELQLETVRGPLVSGRRLWLEAQRAST